tara:strand:- start:1892 stop:2491 length:600 start_codon:yes stop_codon:yes gene_type:complete
MNTLSEKSRNNLKIIKNLGNDSILSSSSSRDIIIQEEFVEVDNINDLENGLFFTFHQCLSDMVNMGFLEKDILINDIEECIQNIFDNKKLDSLMDEDNSLCEIMNDIDLKLDLLKESYYYGSPFYKYYTKYCLIKDYINNIIEDPPCYGLVKFLKVYNKYVTKLNKQHMPISDTETDTSGDSESEGEGEEERKCDNKFE